MRFLMLSVGKLPDIDAEESNRCQCIITEATCKVSITRLNFVEIITNLCCVLGYISLLFKGLSLGVENVLLTILLMPVLYIFSNKLHLYLFF